MNTKTNHFCGLTAKLHCEEVLELAGIFYVDVHLVVLRPFPINLKLSKDYNLTPQSTFCDVCVQNYT